MHLRNTSKALTVGTLILSSCVSSQRNSGSESTAPPFDYPKARIVDQVDDYHGVAVADPYRWLEDPDSPEARSWIDGQNELTFGYLEQIPAREPIKNRLTEVVTTTPTAERPREQQHKAP